jgi:phosphatidylglycerol:prolipoprotein diacylglycerol transferase
MLVAGVHPILFELGAFQVPAYGVALGIAFIACTWLGIRRGERLGLSGRVLADAGLLILAASLVGSRLLFALEQREILRAPLARWPELLNPIPATLGSGAPGLSMTGGVLLALVSVLVMLRLRGLPVLRYADVAAPSVALGEGITRIGCFLNGCCGGTACSLAWCVRFPGAVAAVHPTQLYASAAAFLLCVGLIALARRGPTPGTVTAAWLLGWSTSRAAVDVFRDYPPEAQLASLGPLAIPAHVPVNLTLFAIGLLMWRRARAASTPAPR